MTDYKRRKAVLIEASREFKAYLNAASEEAVIGERQRGVDHFTRLGRRYGLLRKFREMGII